MEVVCTSHKCLIEEELLDELKFTVSSWNPSNRSQFWGVTLEDGRSEKLGTEKPGSEWVFNLQSSSYLIEISRVKYH